MNIIKKIECYLKGHCWREYGINLNEEIWIPVGREDIHDFQCFRCGKWHQISKNTTDKSEIEAFKEISNTTFHKYYNDRYEYIGWRK